MKRGAVILFAWVLWAHHSTLPPSGQERWSRVNAHETKKECEDFIDTGLTAIMENNTVPAVKRVGNSLWFMKNTPPITQTAYECWPDTVDPREPKGK